MLFMIIETFRDTKLVRERFERSGRLLPEGIVYHASWATRWRTVVSRSWRRPIKKHSAGGLAYGMI